MARTASEPLAAAAHATSLAPTTAARSPTPAPAPNYARSLAPAPCAHESRTNASRIGRRPSMVGRISSHGKRDSFHIFHVCEIRGSYGPKPCPLVRPHSKIGNGGRDPGQPWPSHGPQPCTLVHPHSKIGQPVLLKGVEASNKPPLCTHLPHPPFCSTHYVRQH
jgi:hypothetical protein